MRPLPRNLSILAVALTLTVALTLILALPGASRAASHLWVVNEVFSNADGSIQFVEMHVPSSAANETNMNNKWIQSVASTDQFIFDENLPPGSTAFAYLLIGTTSYAALPGAPAPDYILPDGFLDLDADTIRWWLYGTGDLTYTSGQLPLDGVNAFHRGSGAGVNSPTNFNGESGSVDANTTSVGDGATTTTFTFYAVYGDGQYRLEFQAPGAPHATVQIFDVNGRLIRSLFDGEARSETAVTWDGRDDQGQAVANGVYFARLEADPHRAVRKLALVR